MTDLTTVRRIRPTALAQATALAGLTLINPAKLPAWGMAAHIAAIAGISAWVAWDDLDEQVCEQARFGYAAGAAGITAALAGPYIKLDRAMVGWLTRRRVPAPRVWLAGLTFAASIAADLLQPSATPEPMPDPEPTPSRPLDPNARLVAEKILAVTNNWGAPTLREQLADARESMDRGESRDAWLEISESAPRTFDSYYAFPYVGRYEADGHIVEVTLHLWEGQLECIGREGDAIPAAWPTPHEVTVSPSTEGA